MHPKKKYQEEEVAVEEVAYEEEAVPELKPEREPVEDRCDQSDDQIIKQTFVVKQLDEQVVLQVLTSTLKGTKYMVVPRMYFEIEKTEELVIMDDCVLVPLKQV